MLPYITQRLKGAAIVQYGELPICETEEGVVIEPEVETQVMDKADQMAGAAGVYVIKAGFQIRATLTRFSAEIYAKALGLGVTGATVPKVIDFNWPEYLPASPLRIAGTLADGTPAVWEFPAASVLPSAGVTLSREPAGIPIVWKALVDPANTQSFGKCTIGQPTP